MDGQTTPDNKRSVNLYTLIWLGCPAFPRDVLPVADKTARTHVYYYFGLLIAIWRKEAASLILPGRV